MSDDDAPKLSDHWLKIVIVLGLTIGYFILCGVLLGWHRVHADWWPLDQSIDGPNLLVSFIWLPIAFLGGWIASEIRAAKTLAKHRVMLGEHEERIKKHLERHGNRMADLLGVSDPVTSDALNSTPGDRQIDQI